jgi:hypothetical protein
MSVVRTCRRVLTTRLMLATSHALAIKMIPATPSSLDESPLWDWRAIN